MTNSHSLNSILSAVGQVAYHNHLPFIFFRLPYSEQIYSMIGSLPKQQVHADLEDNKRGFIFSDFRQERCLLMNDLVSFKNTQLQPQAPKSKYQTELENQITDYLKEPRSAKISYYQGENSSLEQAKPNDYQDLVRKAIEHIRAEYLDKVVLATRKIRPLESRIDIADLFSKLLSYKQAFISLVSMPKVGTWIGATPELLLKKRGDDLETVALAGTKTRLALTSQTWSAKEIREHGFVVQDISACFESLKLDYAIMPAEDFPIGSIVHIKKHITTTIKDSRQATEILKMLHPTSAVCGTPKRAALNFISQNERFPRDFYAGYLGFGTKTNYDLFVNLRCARLFDSQIILYSGAGITQDSVPAQEQAEINAKFSILETFLE